MFNRDFTGTYLRPGNAQLLAMCRQKDGESDRAYLTRWTSLRNSCEGILELQAVQYFIQGCRDSTLLKHRLLRKSPKTMAELMAVADEYATADAGMINPIRVDEAGRVVTDNPATRKPRREENQAGETPTQPASARQRTIAWSPRLSPPPKESRLAASTTAA